MARLPPLATLWNNYPLGPSESVKAMIGGAVNASWIANTCTIRLSRALNYCGDPTFRVRRQHGMHAVSGADGKLYAYRVREMKVYLERKYGPANVRATSDFEDAVTYLSGIIMFNVNWSDATGHFDLWDGFWIRNHAYFAEASEVLLWRTD